MPGTTEIDILLVTSRQYCCAVSCSREVYRFPEIFTPPWPYNHPLEPMSMIIPFSFTYIRWSILRAVAAAGCVSQFVHCVEPVWVVLMRVYRWIGMKCKIEWFERFICQTFGFQFKNKLGRRHRFSFWGRGKCGAVDGWKWDIVFSIFISGCYSIR